MATYNLTADGDTEIGGINAKKEFAVFVAGDFGGGTLNVQFRQASGWVNYSSGETGTFTAAGERVFFQGGDEDKINLSLSGATSPDLDVTVVEQRI
jgi:hypothetical protein